MTKPLDAGRSGALSAGEASEQEATHDPRAVDDALRAQMRADASEMEKQVPQGHIRVRAKVDRYFDGDAIYSYSANGVELPETAITIHGIAAAIRPGALFPFDTIVVASISPHGLARIRAKQTKLRAKDAAAEAKEAATELAAFEAARTSGRPVVLKSDFVECDGSARDCNYDDLRTYALPDGTVKKVRTHSH